MYVLRRLGVLSGKNLCLGFQRRGVKSFRDVEFISKVTDEYQKIFEDPSPNTKRERDERRKQAFKYVYYNPTFLQRLLILKARFFATGWIHLLTAVLTYSGVKFMFWLEKYTNKDRYYI
ncbi:putative integral membrane protein [Theileria parva strain Muguga]|uniref:Uncharacterized protein n=1 Tax=Theileria parva TaxID=5875 RepID=Q4N8Z2_THEPA|nr:putative integral membrane protein [Theileria parva strain Muguga]EAN33566.1 putative integral membrane protein [Theileria parva strain Muguga]|eukprot:XP_765849.1 hypothetical protein [Theileria parva strain Muguga]